MDRSDDFTKGRSGSSSASPEARAEGVVTEVKRLLIFRRRIKVEEIGVLLAVVILFVAASIGSPYFLTVSNLLNLTRRISLVGTMAVGMTYVLIMGEIDLSLGGVYVLMGIILGLLMNNGIDPWLAFLLTLGAGAMVGFVNGVITTKVKLPSFIVTLGMISVTQGLALLLSKGVVLSAFPDVPSFFFIGSGRVGPVPTPAVIMFVTLLLGGLFLRRSVFGYRVYAVGGNLRAARLSGIKVDRIKIQVFIMMSTLVALASAMSVATVRAASPTGGGAYLLGVVAAVIIGGASLSGGEGTILGSFLGALLMGILENGLVLMGVSAYHQTVIVGVMIILVLAIGNWVKQSGKLRI